MILIVIALFVVIIVRSYRLKTAEQAVALVLRTGCEVERVRHSGPAAVANRDSPEAFDRLLTIKDFVPEFARILFEELSFGAAITPRDPALVHVVGTLPEARAPRG